MLRFPAGLSAELFLQTYWQEKPLSVAAALDTPRPTLSRDELAWLATLEDVESRLVFTERTENGLRYRVESGPFEASRLQDLPAEDWTLLVHDVEKHLPALRAQFAAVSFIPDWRIDDLMVSFAAPGGGVGPHTDNYDVFLCQDFGVRKWRVSEQASAAAPEASEDLYLLQEFTGEKFEHRRGDVLYLPPGVAHWGTALDACMTYSIGMRAPQRSDLTTLLPDQEAHDPFYRDPDLSIAESTHTGFISAAAATRAARLMPDLPDDDAARRLGISVTQTKDWIRPETLSMDAAQAVLNKRDLAATLQVHGMARLAWDSDRIYCNGQARSVNPAERAIAKLLCKRRRLPLTDDACTHTELLLWLLQVGGFSVDE